MNKLSTTAKHPSSQTKGNPAPAAQAEKAAAGTTAEQRLHMIAEAAYYLAEQRGFQGGDPARDWLQAEAETDHRLLGTPSH
jgi:Protein of unknown function (DUF2934)